MKIGSAILVGAMLAMILPRANQMIKGSPKGSGDDWRAFIIPIAIVILFVILLIKAV